MEERRTAKLAVRLRPQGLFLLQNLARFNKKPFAQFVRDCLGQVVEDQLALVEAAMRARGWDEKKRNRKLKKFLFTKNNVKKATKKVKA